jgi:antitoxin ParD1/3/4
MLVDLEAGKYPTPIDVVEDALRLLQQRDHQQRLDRLREQIRVGVEEADRGELIDGEKAFDEIERQLPS